jgi:hypothetical protein
MFSISEGHHAERASETAIELVVGSSIKLVLHRTLIQIFGKKQTETWAEKLFFDTFSIAVIVFV